MKKEDCFLCGKLIKTHGFKGQLVASCDQLVTDLLHQCPFIFIDVEGLLVPFFLEEFSESGIQNLILKFEDIDSEVMARKICNCELWLPRSILPEESKKHTDIKKFTGFRVSDKTMGDIGTLQAILEMPQQQMLQVMQGKIEILIPVVEEIIHKINTKNKTIYIDAPEGLIEMYLGK